MCLTSNVIFNWQKNIVCHTSTCSVLDCHKSHKIFFGVQLWLVIAINSKYVYVSKYYGHLSNMDYISAQSETREQYFAAKSDACLLICLSTYLSLATSWISLFCRSRVLTKMFINVPKKARLSTYIKSCHCHKCSECHVTLKKADFSHGEL